MSSQVGAPDPVPDPDRAGIAAFDFDGTLISGDSLMRFLALVAGRREAGRACIVLSASLPRIYRAGGGRDEVKAALLARVLTGLSAERLAEYGERYAVSLRRRIRPAMEDRISWHRHRDHRLVLVSASLAVYLEPLGRLLGFDAVLATGLEVDGDGRLTGRLQGSNVRRSEKEARLKRWLAENLDGRPWELWAYGDSQGDRELLAMADHPHRP
jgi:phosphatidylglycerophosphatase C